MNYINESNIGIYNFIETKTDFFNEIIEIIKIKNDNAKKNKRHFRVVILGLEHCDILKKIKESININSEFFDLCFVSFYKKSGSIVEQKSLVTHSIRTGMIADPDIFIIKSNDDFKVTIHDLIKLIESGHQVFLMSEDKELNIELENYLKSKNNDEDLKFSIKNFKRIN